MKHLIREWLGITELIIDNTRLRGELVETNNAIRNLTEIVRITHNALGRIIVKLDPIYAQDPFSKSTRDESDKIAERVIQQLRGEDLARRHTTGEP